MGSAPSSKRYRQKVEQRRKSSEHENSVAGSAPPFPTLCTEAEVARPVKNPLDFRFPENLRRSHLVLNKEVVSECNNKLAILISVEDALGDKKYLIPDAITRNEQEFGTLKQMGYVTLSIDDIGYQATRENIDGLIKALAPYQFKWRLIYVYLNCMCQWTDFHETQDVKILLNFEQGKTVQLTTLTWLQRLLATLGGHQLVFFLEGVTLFENIAAASPVSSSTGATHALITIPSVVSQATDPQASPTSGVTPKVIVSPNSHPLYQGSPPSSSASFSSKMAAIRLLFHAVLKRTRPLVDTVENGSSTDIAGHKYSYQELNQQAKLTTYYEIHNVEVVHASKDVPRTKINGLTLHTLTPNADHEPFWAPELPKHLIQRRCISSLKVLLLGSMSQSAIGITSVEGRALPGLGRSVTTLSIAWDLDVLKFFSDGVFWLKIGYNLTVQRACALQRQLLAQLLRLDIDDVQEEWATVEEGRQILHKYAQKCRCLVILDNVWTGDAVSPFIIKSRRPAAVWRVLFTTHDEEICEECHALVHPVAPTQMNEALALLNTIAGSDDGRHQQEANELANLCRHIPHAIALVSGALRRSGCNWEKIINDMQEKLKEKRLENMESPGVTPDNMQEQSGRFGSKAKISSSSALDAVKMVQIDNATKAKRRASVMGALSGRTIAAYHEDVNDLSVFYAALDICVMSLPPRILLFYQSLFYLTSRLPLGFDTLFDLWSSIDNIIQDKFQVQDIVRLLANESLLLLVHAGDEWFADLGDLHIDLLRYVHRKYPIPIQSAKLAEQKFRVLPSASTSDIGILPTTEIMDSPATSWTVDTAGDRGYSAMQEFLEGGAHNKSGMFMHPDFTTPLTISNNQSSDVFPPPPDGKPDPDLLTANSEEASSSVSAGLRTNAPSSQSGTSSTPSTASGTRSLHVRASSSYSKVSQPSTAESLQTFDGGLDDLQQQANEEFRRRVEQGDHPFSKPNESTHQPRPQLRQQQLQPHQQRRGYAGSRSSSTGRAIDEDQRQDLLQTLKVKRKESLNPTDEHNPNQQPTKTSNSSGHTASQSTGASLDINYGSLSYGSGAYTSDNSDDEVKKGPPPPMDKHFYMPTSLPTATSTSTTRNHNTGLSVNTKSDPIDGCLPSLAESSIFQRITTPQSKQRPQLKATDAVGSTSVHSVAPSTSSTERLKKPPLPLLASDEPPIYGLPPQDSFMTDPMPVHPPPPPPPAGALPPFHAHQQTPQQGRISGRGSTERSATYSTPGNVGSSAVHSRANSQSSSSQAHRRSSSLPRHSRTSSGASSSTPAPPSYVMSTSKQETEIDRGVQDILAKVASTTPQGIGSAPAHNATLMKAKLQYANKQKPQGH